jgi:biotin carboxyl carrier protein
MIRRYQAQLGERTVDVSVAEEEGGGLLVSVDGHARRVDACALGERAWSLVLDGAAYLIDIEGEGGELSVHVGDHAVPVRIVDARRQLLAQVTGSRGQKSGPFAVRSPMPGKVVKVLVEPGAAVKAGQGLVVVEAMKMENEMRAPRDGTVAEVAVREGQAVEAGETLASLA